MAQADGSAPAEAASVPLRAHRRLWHARGSAASLALSARGLRRDATRTSGCGATGVRAPHPTARPAVLCPSRAQQQRKWLEGQAVAPLTVEVGGGSTCMTSGAIQQGVPTNVLRGFSPHAPRCSSGAATPVFFNRPALTTSAAPPAAATAPPARTAFDAAHSHPGNPAPRSSTAPARIDAPRFPPSEMPARSQHAARARAAAAAGWRRHRRRRRNDLGRRQWPRPCYSASVSQACARVSV